MKTFSTSEMDLDAIVRHLRSGLWEGLGDTENVVRQIIADVHQRGDEALLEYITRFDCPDMTLEDLEVSPEEFDEARRIVGRSFRRSLEKAAENIRRFHEKQLPTDWFTLDEQGATLGLKYTPIQRVGIYIPGGTAPYPSTVLMTTIPARVAGVEEICLATPASSGCSIHPTILAAADVAGCRRIFKMGGAAAIAAFAFSTKRVPKVDKIVGPGNLYVMLAKRLVYGIVGLDGLYGPTEMVILADSTADPRLIAADLLAQAEHGGTDSPSSVLLITDTRAIATETEAELQRQIRDVDRQSLTVEALSQGGATILVKDPEEGGELVSLLAPEHVGLYVSNPWAILPRIRNAGCILLGQDSPAAASDYLAGPAHVLPTSGTARFSSGLGVRDFLKSSSLIMLSPRWLQANGQAICEIAALEGFDAHARSIRLRLRLRGKN